MSLRDLVTGSDLCSPEEAGSSNAAAAFSATLVGQPTKAQEGLFEHQRAPFRGQAPLRHEAFPSSVAQVSHLAAQENAFHIPGALNSINGAELPADFSEAWPESQVAFHDVHASGVPYPSDYVQLALRPFLQGFVGSGREEHEYVPMPLSGVELSVADQCRIRDRSTILARHLFASKGLGFADAQVARLLESLKIPAQELPATASLQRAWDEAQFAGPYAQPHNQQDELWVQQFADLGLGAPPGEQWAADFAGVSAPGPSALASRQPGWAEEFSGSHDAWTTEFVHANGNGQLASTQQLSANGERLSAASLAQTRALAETLTANKDPKFQNSKFVNFVSKMSRGEILLTDNQAVEVPGTSVAAGAAWAESFGASQAPELEEVWQSAQGHADAQGDYWAKDFVAEGGTDWASDFFQADRAEQAEMEARYQEAIHKYSKEYVMAPNNPFLTDPNSFERGKELFRNGVLSEALLAVEAELQRNPKSVEAWRLLGTIHAENDDDVQAILALNRAEMADPRNAEVLLSLGVSHTNELDNGRAIHYLLAWLRLTSPNPGWGGPEDPSQLLTTVIGIFQREAETYSRNADVWVALGVLCSLSREYGRAADAFRTALQLRPNDYSLWNKLGATLANSSRSVEAVAAYQRALDLKPNYMRAWTNMGISQANLGNYEASAKYYVSALSLNPRADNVWGYLRTSLACMNRMDLIAALDNEDLELLKEQLPL